MTKNTAAINYSIPGAQRGKINLFARKPRRHMRLRIGDGRGRDTRIAWPSGQGHEIGVFRIPFSSIPGRLRLNASALSYEDFQALRLMRIEEDGADAYLVQGLIDGPLVLLTEPGMPPGMVSVIVDASIKGPHVARKLASLLGRGMDPA